MSEEDAEPVPASQDEEQVAGADATAQVAEDGDNAVEEGAAEADTAQADEASPGADAEAETTEAAEGDVAVGEEGEGKGEGQVDGEEQDQGEEGQGAPGADEDEQAEGSPETAGEEAEHDSTPPAEEPGPPPPPPEPPYVPPEVGDDYIPVAQLPPLPEAQGVNDEGKPVPLPGVLSIFLTGTTVEMVGLQHLGSDKEGGQLMGHVSKEDLLKDVQFRGAISDFHPFKAQITEADYDPIMFRINEDDIFGDGNNFQLACKKEAADTWAYILTETERRKQLLKDEELRAAIEKAKPRSKKARKVKPWISQGSEVEIEEASVRSRREAVCMVVSRTRRDFNQPYKLFDKDAHELWNSSQMECRPFKDPNFELRKMEQDMAVQAVAPSVETAVQAGGLPPRPKAVQYQPLTLPPAMGPDAIRKLAQSQFLERAIHHCEVALIQNEIANIFADDFVALTDEEGMNGNRKETSISETQSFTHLTYSKNKVVSAIQWLPHRRGVVAVACTEALSHAERVARSGRPANAHILIWNFKDSIHPECVLQAPYEVFAFQYNPSNPEIVAAGCYNGQVVIWDTTHQHDRIAKAKAAASRQADPASGQGGDEPSIPIIKCKYLTTVDLSHHTMVMDLKWLPGIEISSRGKVTKAADGNRECNFLATVASDGKVNFWDIRVDRLMKKGKKAEDVWDLIWKPCHSIHVISLIGLDLSGHRLNFRMSDLDRGVLAIGSSDGELVAAEFVKPEGEDNPDYVKSITQAHLGPVVSLERSPFFEDVLLTVGDWTFQVWKEGTTTALFTSGYSSEYYTCGCWSPSRPAVLFLANQAGALEVWDLLDRSHEPSITVTLASGPIMSLAFTDVAAAAAASGGPAGAGASQQALAAAQQAAAQFLALGDAAGVLRIVELPRNLRRPVSNEKKLMGVFLDREAERVHDVASRKPQREAAKKQWEEVQKKAQEEAEAAAKEAAAKEASGMPAPAKSQGGALAKAALAALDEKAEAEYYKMEHRLKISLGLIAAET